MWVSMLILVMLVVPALGWAASPWASGATYGDKIRAKADFGAKNFLGGWTELITEPKNAPRNPAGLAKGIAKGIQNTLVYTIGGALHLATFAIPQIDIPIPDNGVSF